MLDLTTVTMQKYSSYFYERQNRNCCLWHWQSSALQSVMKHTKSPYGEIMSRERVSYSRLD
uniref:Uncharacterized protein n=1 Tax=Anguilla anguilla TaxID=7936 RepID=A0A0E9QEU1_ANGAN